MVRRPRPPAGDRRGLREFRTAGCGLRAAELISHSCDVATFVGRVPRDREISPVFAGAWNSHPSDQAMTAHFGVYLLLLTAPSGSTQPAAVAPGDIRCSACALTGQKAGPAAFDESQIEFVANPAIAFDEGQTFRTNVLARVLSPAPLILEILDSRRQMLDRHMEVVAEDPDNGRDPAT